MSAAVRVRAARISDAATIAAFNRALAQESEDLELDGRRLERGVAAVLADPARGRYLLAEREKEVVGCLMLTTEWSDWRNGWFWWIQSVYTHPEARRAGVYKTLYERVLEEARSRGDVIAVRLYVERKNDAAKRTYESLGMAVSSYELYETRFWAVSP